MKSILDPTFKYTDAAHTDIRKLFERVRREIEQAALRGAHAYDDAVRQLDDAADELRAVQRIGAKHE